MVGLIKKPWFNWLIQWPDPDIEISGGEGGGRGHPDPQIRGWQSPKTIFLVQK